MKYFRLHPFCRFVYNGGQGCIYDLSSGAMWDIEKDSIEELIKAENNLPIQKSNFFNMLCSKSLGEYYDNPIWIDQDDFGIDDTVVNLIGEKIYIKTLFIVFNKCSLACNFCSAELNRKTGCKVHNCIEIIGEEEISSVVKEAQKVGCEEIVYIGGDPILYKKMLRSLIEEFAVKEMRQEIYTNGSLLDEKWIEFLAQNKVKLNLQILTQPVYSNGLNDFSIESILLNCRKYGAQPALTILLFKYNGNVFKDILKISDDYNCQLYIDTIIDPEKFRIQNWKEILGKGIRFEYPINPSTYSMQRLHNSCIYGKAAIMLDGTILPCPMMDTYSIGNIKQLSLLQILHGSKYKNLVELAKEKQDKCGNCAYRYGCSDCRAIEYNKTKCMRSNILCGRN